MPKQTASIPNDLLLAKLGDRQSLSDELWLIAPQVGMLLGRTKGQLEDDRKVGRPPKFKKDGGSIRYRLGTVRDHMLGLPEFNNTVEAAIANAALGFATFTDWLDGARPGDEWPFLIRRKGGPVDFWKSLTMADVLEGDEECAMLRLDDYLAKRREASWAAEGRVEGGEIGAVTSGGTARVPGGRPRGVL